LGQSPTVILAAKPKKKTVKSQDKAMQDLLAHIKSYLHFILDPPHKVEARSSLDVYWRNFRMWYRRAEKKSLDKWICEEVDCVSSG
jgi:hypothetical protein